MTRSTPPDRGRAVLVGLPVALRVAVERLLAPMLDVESHSDVASARDRLEGDWVDVVCASDQVRGPSGADLVAYLRGRGQLASVVLAVSDAAPVPSSTPAAPDVRRVARPTPSSLSDAIQHAASLARMKRLARTARRAASSSLRAAARSRSSSPPAEARTPTAGKPPSRG